MHKQSLLWICSTHQQQVSCTEKVCLSRGLSLRLPLEHQKRHVSCTEKVCLNSHYYGYVALANSGSVAQKRYACRGAIYEALTNSGSVEHKRYA